MKSIWPLIGRALYYIGGPFVFPFTLNKSRRVKVALIDPETDRILLSQTWIGLQEWNLVGGGIQKGEDMYVAAIREVKEETGLNISTNQLEHIDEITESEYRATYTSHVFLAHVPEKAVERRKIELLGLEWFDRKHLPKPYNKQTIKSVERKLSQQG